MVTSDYVHSVAIRCNVPPEDAFACVANVHRVGEWALGCWGAVTGPDGIAAGWSLFDGEKTYVRVDSDPDRRVVDFEVGASPETLVRRITVRVVDGDSSDGLALCSLLILTAWRIASMDRERWHRLVVTHEAEIFLLRHVIEVSGT